MSRTAVAVLFLVAGFACIGVGLWWGFGYEITAYNGLPCGSAFLPNMDGSFCGNLRDSVAWKAGVLAVLGGVLVIASIAVARRRAVSHA